MIAKSCYTPIEESPGQKGRKGRYCQTSPPAGDLANCQENISAENEEQGSSPGQNRSAPYGGRIKQERQSICRALRILQFISGTELMKGSGK